MKTLPELQEIFDKPFEWCEIPAGDSSQGESEHLPGFYISKYPVLSSQFAKFIEADGYNQQQWWTEQGWKARVEGWNFNSNREPSGITWTEPRDWKYTQSQGEHYPAAGVSWYEAIAFCNWLNHLLAKDTSGENQEKPVRVSLPTKQQWLYLMYNDKKLEWAVMNVLDTMWEWCLDSAEKDGTNHDIEYRIMGTAPRYFGYKTNEVPASNRIRLNPFDWFDFEYGFRLVVV